ncbi:transporter [Sulfurifustis variabilis]|uniref:Transporter n=1 Tax=Sulfurifustis variabilis TaxID=1675686 RepID=A0A1B4V1V3_9GAMM|nr:AEC family transporter [Sulfurifustis variabilis]BAU47476.1 transporter [Sulfurifustis variabilis]
MQGSVLTILFFLALGIGWRFVSPQGIAAASLQRHLQVLAHYVILPVAVFFILAKLPMNAAAMKILWYVLGTSAITLAVAWVWLHYSKMAPKTKGALLIAAGFGNVLFLGVPLNKALVGDWSMRIAVEYGLLANVLLLYTAGAILSRSFTEAGAPRFKGLASEVLAQRFWLREPLLWAALAGLFANFTSMEFPWFASTQAAIYELLLPLLLLSTALAVSWSDAWKTQFVTVLPAAAIQLILAPLAMWAMVSLFGSVGAKGTQALMLNSMLPTALLGFAACERHKLDTGTYALAFSLTSALALVTVPLWFALLF